MAKVIRVYGKADNYDIEFTPNNGVWEVDVPPDMTDGVYAVQLTAIDEVGEIAYWVGELYMTDGVCCLHINEIPYRVRIAPRNEYRVQIRNGKHNIKFTPTSYSQKYEKRYDVAIRKTKKFSSEYIVDFSTKLSTSGITHSIIDVNAKKITIQKEREIKTKFTPKTEILMRKGCCCGRR